eukprot:946508-Karenia_brevis.AAC.1
MAPLVLRGLAGLLDPQWRRGHWRLGPLSLRLMQPWDATRSRRSHRLTSDGNAVSFSSLNIA